MAEGTIHIVGAGLAGLSAATHLAAAGRSVRLYEATSHAGGRCRSYFDKDLGCVIDNGNHLLLSCNEAALTYLDIIGSRATLTGPDAAIFPYMDLRTGQRWQIAMDEGLFPSWIFSKNRRVPQTCLRDYLALIRLFRAGRWQTVAECVDAGNPLYEKLIEPLCVAIMNTKPEEASARMFGHVLKIIFRAGGKGAHPLTVREGLSETCVDPALSFVTARGGHISYGQRLRSLSYKNDEVCALHFNQGEVVLEKWDWVILALPAWVMNDILPTLPTPTEYRSIVNAHFAVPALKEPQPITGLVGGVAEWVFSKPGLISTTTSAAEHVVEKSAEELAALLWKDVAALYGLDTSMLPAYKIVKEKRATFAATPAQVIRRPKVEARHGNMLFCGDWVNTGLPSTIEGSIASGRAAAGCIIPPARI